MTTTTNPSPLDQVNSLFGNPVQAQPQAQSQVQPQVQPQAQPQPQAQNQNTILPPTSLASQNPMFNEPIGPSQSSIDQANDYKNSGVDLSGGSGNKPTQTEVSPADSAVVGGAAGAILGGKQAMAPAPKNNSLLNAQATAQAQSQSAKKINDFARVQEIEHAKEIERTKLNLNNARVDHAQATANHMQAREDAIKLNAMPEDHELVNAKNKIASGDKWAFGNPETGSTGIIGAEHAGGKSVAEAASNYRLQNSLSPTEASKFKVSRSGLIIPNELPSQTPLTPAQQLAKQRVIDTHAEVFGDKGTANQVAEHEGRLASLEKKGPMSAQLENKIIDKNLKAQESATKAQYLEDALKESNVAKFGRIAGKFIGPAIGGASAGYEGAEAYNEFNKGNYPMAALHGASALGGALATIPFPLTKGIGTALMAPGIAYDVYNELKPESEAPLSKAK